MTLAFERFVTGEHLVQHGADGPQVGPSIDGSAFELLQRLRPLWYEEAAQMVTQPDNVWGDVSGFGLFALRRMLRLGVTVDWGKLFWGNDSPPFAYPMNLRLLTDTLRREGAEPLTERLLVENGRRFGEQFLPS